MYKRQVYNLFNAQTIKDYIAGFFANILISGAVIIILYFVGLIIGKLIIKALDILNDVPVIGFFSRAGGFVVGIIKGICVLWIIGIAVSYTHLDVYKRQGSHSSGRNRSARKRTMTAMRYMPDRLP